MRTRLPGAPRCGFWVLALVLLAAPLRAELLQCRGELKDGAGRPQNGTFLLFFRVWDAGGAGSLLWEEGRYVAVQNGEFSAVMGDRLPLPEGLAGRSHRFGIEPPPGTGWSATVRESSVSGAPAAPPVGVAPATAPVVAPAPTPAAAPITVPVAAPAPVPAPAAPAPAPVGAVPSSAAAQVPAEFVQRDLAQVKEEALKAKQEAEQAKRRLDQLEKAMQDRVSLEKGPQSEASEVGIHVVQPGETLRSIAIKVYGEADRWSELYEANRERLQRGGELTPGQKLVVPAFVR